MAEKKHLITQDIVSATKWFLDSPSSIIKAEKGGDGTMTWKDKALQDLKNKLQRVKTDFPEAAQRGVAFENQVYRKAWMEDPGGSENFRKVCSLVKGFAYHQKGKKTIVVEDLECLLFTKYDAILYGENARIRDLKTTESYKKGKHLTGFQHKLYCYVANIPCFDYVIAEWKEYPAIKEVHVEEYYCDDMVQLEKDILFEIKECFLVIRDLGLWDDYRTKYCLY